MQRDWEGLGSRQLKAGRPPSGAAAARGHGHGAGAASVPARWLGADDHRGHAPISIVLEDVLSVNHRAWGRRPAKGRSATIRAATSGGRTLRSNVRRCGVNASRATVSVCSSMSEGQEGSSSVERSLQHLELV